jgi:hypothetical protein
MTPAERLELTRIVLQVIERRRDVLSGEDGPCFDMTTVLGADLRLSGSIGRTGS